MSEDFFSVWNVLFPCPRVLMFEADLILKVQIKARKMSIAQLRKEVSIRIVTCFLFSLVGFREAFVKMPPKQDILTTAKMSRGYLSH